jgi:stalled ribosome rescue protein Dom34
MTYSKNKAMSTDKKLAVWMDHTSAHIMEYPLDPSVSRTIISDFTNTEKRETLEKSEHVMNNTKQHDQLAYFKGLAKVIGQYNTVLLFGPSNAKSELLNFLKSDHHFDKIKIRALSADKMNDHERQEFVRDYFSQPINL